MHVACAQCANCPWCINALPVSPHACSRRDPHSGGSLTGAVWEQRWDVGAAGQERLCQLPGGTSCTLYPPAREKSLFQCYRSGVVCTELCRASPFLPIQTGSSGGGKKSSALNRVRLEPGATAGGCSRTSTPGRRWEPLPPQTSAAAKSNCCRFGSGFLALWKGQCCRSLQAWCPWKIIGLWNPDSTRRVLVQHREELQESTG